MTEARLLNPCRQGCHEGIHPCYTRDKLCSNCFNSCATWIFANYTHEKQMLSFYRVPMGIEISEVAVDAWLVAGAPPAPENFVIGEDGEWDSIFP